MALIELYANNAVTTVAGAITNTATSVTLSPGTGALFPTVTPGTNFFRLSFKDAATTLQTEIVICTARTGDVCTIVRAQEGTAAQAWSAGDIIGNENTAGAMSFLAQIGTVQGGATNYVVDTGAVNAITAVISPAISALTAGLPIHVKMIATNTGATTINVNSLGANAILDTMGAALTGGELQLGDVVRLIYDGTNFRVDPTVGRLLRTLVYRRDPNTNVQQVSVNGGAYGTTNAATYTKLPAARFVGGEMVGGGGSGGGAQGTGSGQYSAGGGGAAGGWAKFFAPAATFGVSALAVNIGAGGPPNSAGLAPGIAGSASSIASLLVCGGGAGGLAGPALSVFPFFSTGGSGGTITGPLVATLMAFGIGSAGGQGLYMQAGNMGSGEGGTSVYGAGGQSTGVSSGGQNGNGSPTFGAGGAGGVCLQFAPAGAQGGAGGAGQLIICDYA